MTDKLIKIPGLPHGWVFTQQEIDLIKAYEPSKEKLYIYVVPGDWSFSENGDYLVLQGTMLDSAISSILFNNKENN